MAAYSQSTHVLLNQLPHKQASNITSKHAISQASKQKEWAGNSGPEVSRLFARFPTVAASLVVRRCAPNRRHIARRSLAARTRASSLLSSLSSPSLSPIPHLGACANSSNGPIRWRKWQRVSDRLRPRLRVPRAALPQLPRRGLQRVRRRGRQALWYASALRSSHAKAEATASSWRMRVLMAAWCARHRPNDCGRDSTVARGARAPRR